MALLCYTTNFDVCWHLATLILKPKPLMSWEERDYYYGTKITKSCLMNFPGAAAPLPSKSGDDAAVARNSILRLTAARGRNLSHYMLSGFALTLLSFFSGKHDVWSYFGEATLRIYGREEYEPGSFWKLKCVISLVVRQLWPKDYSQRWALPFTLYFVVV